MGFYRFYALSMILTFILTIAAVVTLLPIFGIIHGTLYTPVSTLILLGLAWINCMIRAELKRKKSSS